MDTLTKSQENRWSQIGYRRVVVIWGVLTHPPQIIQKIMLKKNHPVYRGTKF
eukprot:SAG11_NODE_38863_length_247_cov_29.432432_1_plen_51_part_01